MKVTQAAYEHDGPVVLTGPIKGTVTCADGTPYDVSAPVVAVAHEQHAAEVAHLIGLRYAHEGHPEHTDTPFVYESPDGEKHGGEHCSCQED